MNKPIDANAFVSNAKSGRLPSRVPIERSSASIVEWDVDGWPETEHVAVRRWTTSPAADWLNSLCPVGTPEFPRMESLDGRPFEAVRDQFEIGFNRLAHEISNLEFAAQHSLNNRERSVWMTVKRKTIGFRKLGEKIPRWMFIDGEEKPSRHHDLPALPPCGVDNRHLDETIGDLIAIGWLSRSASDRYRGNQSHVYLPFPAQWLIDRFFHHVDYAAGRGWRGGDRNETNLGKLIADTYRQETLRRCAGLLVPPPDYAALAPATVHKETVARRKARAASRLQLGLQPKSDRQ